MCNNSPIDYTTTTPGLKSLSLKEESLSLGKVLTVSFKDKLRKRARMETRLCSLGIRVMISSERHQTPVLFLSAPWRQQVPKPARNRALPTLKWMDPKETSHQVGQRMMSALVWKRALWLVHLNGYYSFKGEWRVGSGWGSPIFPRVLLISLKYTISHEGVSCWPQPNNEPGGVRMKAHS